MREAPEPFVCTFVTRATVRNELYDEKHDSSGITGTQVCSRSQDPVVAHRALACTGFFVRRSLCPLLIFGMKSQISGS